MATNRCPNLLAEHGRFIFIRDDCGILFRPILAGYLEWDDWEEAEDVARFLRLEADVDMRDC